MRRQARDWVKISAEELSINDYYLQNTHTHTNHLKLRNKKMNNPI